MRPPLRCLVGLLLLASSWPGLGAQPAGQSPDTDDFSGIYAIEENGQAHAVVKIEKRGDGHVGRECAPDSARGGWGKPFELEKVEFPLSEDNDADALPGFRLGMAVLLKVPRHWTHGQFVSNTGFALIYGDHGIDVYRDSATRADALPCLR